MRSDIAEKLTWTSFSERGVLRSMRTDVTTAARDAAFEEVSREPLEGNQASPARAPKQDSNELVACLEMQLDQLEAQCSQLRRLLEQAAG